jgi:hypothetical protein
MALLSWSGAFNLLHSAQRQNAVFLTFSLRKLTSGVMAPPTSDLIPAQIKIRTPTLATGLRWKVENISEHPLSGASINWAKLSSEADECTRYRWVNMLEAAH